MKKEIKIAGRAYWKKNLVGLSLQGISKNSQYTMPDIPVPKTPLMSLKRGLVWTQSRQSTYTKL